MTQREQQIADLVLAAAVPPVPFWATLVAQVSMCGFKVVPPDTWPDLISAIVKTMANAAEEAEMYEAEMYEDEDEGDGTGALGEALKAVGFTEHENDTRSGDHDHWHANELGTDEKKAAAQRGVPVWVIPYDELKTIAMEEYLEESTITRILFVGTEAELRDALGRVFPG